MSEPRVRVAKIVFLSPWEATLRRERRRLRAMPPHERMIIHGRPMTPEEYREYERSRRSS
jgi:hypothetical protein